jgi:PAS domain S-box-containing protein
MFRKELRESIRYKFLKDISVILLISTIVLTTVIALNEEKRFEYSLMTKGQSFASYIAKLSLDPLIMRDSIQLDSLVNEANKDDEIAYTVIRDAQGNLITSQYASMNYMLPRIQTVLSGLSKDSEVPDIIAAIKKKEAIIELSVPIRTSDDTIGTVTIGLLEYKIHQQIARTILFVIALNLAVMFALGSVLFIASRKTLLDPIIELGHAAERLAKGDLSTHVKIQAMGEVRMLVDSFNKMARDLQKTTVSKEYVDNIFKSMIDTLIVASPDGTIRTVNHAACELLGYREEELTGQPIKIIFAEDGERAFEELIKFRLMKNAEYTYITKDKRKIPVLISSSVIYSSDATPQGIVCVAVDITERKRAEEALNRSSEELQHINEELKNFAYIVSHDLRAPLVNIKGFSEELGRSTKDLTSLLEKYPGHVGADGKRKTEELLKKDIPEALGFISSSVTRMDALINSILKLSRLGRNELKRELVHTEELIHPLLKTLAHQIDMHKADVTIGPLPDIIMDRTAAEQIFGNLLDNALKYLEPSRPGKIAVTAEQNAGETTFTIRDNGRGIAKEDTQRVFELFRRVGRQNVPGEGMGLTYVKTLVRRLGGRIWCESEPGVGSVFSFTIPARAQREK